MPVIILNLTAIQKIAIAEKYRPIYEAKARENMTSGINKYSPLPNLVNPLCKIDTTQKLADISGVSKETYRMGAKILGSDNGRHIMSTLVNVFIKHVSFLATPKIGLTSNHTITNGNRGTAFYRSPYHNYTVKFAYRSIQFWLHLSCP